MKKKLSLKKLSLLSVALMVAIMAVVFFKSGDNFKVSAATKHNNVATSAKSGKKIRYKIQMSTNYYIPSITKKGVLHYTLNGWKDTLEQDMVQTDSYSYGSGVFTTYYTYETIITVNEGDVVDYCFKFITTKDTEGWINNENNNFQVKVLASNVPCSYTVEYDRPYHEASAIDYVDLCYTLDEWKSTKYSRMEFHSVVVNGNPVRNYFSTTVHGYETDSLEYCFRILKCTGEQVWDNNNGYNYRVSPIYQPK